MRLLLTATIAFVILFAPPARSEDNARATPQDDAAALYARAAGAIKVRCPASTNNSFPDYPPFGPLWERIAKQAWDANAPARALAHDARSHPAAHWPDGDDPRLLNKLRALANDLGDAALYRHTLADDAAAITIARDALHLGELLEERPSKTLLRTLVGAGVTALATNRLQVIASGVALTRDANDAQFLHVKSAQDLIAHLLDQRDPQQQLTEILGPRGTGRWNDPKVGVERLTETLNRANAERTFAAMSLACQLFRFDKGRWPAGLDELFPDYLPRVPKDPWGDGRQTFGYALLKAALPDGGDRPLLYSRCNATDGLRYRTDAPQYSFYNNPRTQTENGPRILQTGQFRDVARWAPPPGPDNASPRLKPLE
jgi:hypothetical protein